MLTIKYLLIINNQEKRAINVKNYTNDINKIKKNIERESLYTDIYILKIVKNFGHFLQIKSIRMT